MRTSTRFFAFLFVVVIAVWAYSDDVTDLRVGGQTAVDALHAQVMKAAPERRADLEAQLDLVCAQKDCAESRLFWHTSLDEAKAAAQRLQRPILALHMLGRLDEELSCANSRFFRTLLYSDDSISSLLRDQYVLYWHSVRPVPRVTIEMGDGRVIRQTITGNSAHYLLDEQGAVLDVLPGLYSPAAFRTELGKWLQLHRSIARADAGSRRRILTQHHSMFVNGAASIETYTLNPTAIDASRLATVKSASERPMLVTLQKPMSMPISELLPLSDQLFIAGEQLGDVAFSAGAIRLIQKKQFGSRPFDERELRDLLDGIRRNVAADTAFNETRIRPRIHEWFANGEVVDLVSLNERVYRELFLTPSDDPWLGLQPPSIFTAIGE